MKPIPSLLLLFASMLLFPGCGKQEKQAAHSALSRENALRSAQACALLASGKVGKIAPTGSMRPTFAENAFVAYEPVKASGCRVGDIVLRRSGTRLIVHRIVRIEASGLVTQGDHNAEEDEGTVGDAELEGRVVAVVFAAE